MSKTLYIDTGLGMADSLKNLRKALTKKLEEEALEEYKERFPDWNDSNSEYYTDTVGGVWDAFRHTYAAARVGSLLQEILEIYGLSPEQAAELAAALSEDLGALREPSEVDSETKMDLVNNKEGAELSKDLDNPTPDEVADAVEDAMMDDQGNLDPNSSIVTSVDDPRLNDVEIDYQTFDALLDAMQAGFDAINDYAFNFGNIMVMLGKVLIDAPSQALHAIESALADAMQDLWDWIQSFGSPLVIDMDMDGQIELVSLEDSSLRWDIDEDGFAEHSGWVTADDGFLAIDLNGDGIVTDHSELFGSTMTDGFTVLSQYDTNADGVIDANDAQFDDLLVWQDVNQNGISEADELYTLAELNIVSIDLNASQPNTTNEGHRISHASSYTVDDGVNGPQSYDIVDVWFEYDDMNTNFIGDYTLDLASLFVTTLRGYGTLPDLHVSASMDNDTSDPDSLMSLLQGFSMLSVDDLFNDTAAVMDQVREIMFRWAGVDGVDPDSRGGDVDARKLEFLEKIMGQDYLQSGNNPDPVLLAAEGVDMMFEFATYQVAGKLIAQAAGAELFNDGVYYNPATDTFEGFTAFNQDTLDALLAKSLDATQVTDKTAFWISVVNTVDSAVGVANLPADALAALESTLQASDSSLSVALLQDKIQKNIDDLLSWTPAGDNLSGTNGDDVYDGTVGDDTYSATYGNDTLSGGIVNDTLYGGAGNDILNGQLGNDRLCGEGNDDTYLFSLGHGNDTIYDNGGADKIVFGPGVTLADLSFTRVGDYDLLITIDPAVGAGSITLENIFSGAVVETLEFSDGSVFDVNSLDHTRTGTSGDDALYGVNVGVGGTGVDTIYGLEGDDTISGAAISGGYSYTAGNHFHGGLGNDTIYGDRADDAYYFNYGDGDDLYADAYGNDKIVFGESITQDMITLTRIGTSNSALLDIDAGLGGSITLQNHLSGSNAFEVLEFFDGSTLDFSSLDLLSYGTSGNDHLYGTTGNDVLYGLDGNDNFHGSNGDDTYHFGLGDDYADDRSGGDDTYVYTGGMDVIYDRYSANDTVVLDVDATINDITIVDGTNVQLVVDSGVNEVRLSYFHNSVFTIENIVFQDGFSASLIDFASWNYGTDSADVLTGSASADTIIGKDGNDTLSGLASNDNMHGGAGDDVLSGGNGLDNLWGGLGADTFAFEGANAFNDTDVIGDFDLSQGDVIDISDLLSGYDPVSDAITDFVQITDDGTNSTLAVDTDGGSDNFVTVATLYNITGLTDEDSLETSGNLIAA